MPILTRGAHQIEYLEEGAGDTVILVHSSVSGNRQWRVLIDSLRDEYRVIAPNLLGYGGTTVWAGTERQTLAVQSELIVALCSQVPGPVHFIGHSFGGAVALKAASILGNRVGKLVLFEPMLAYLLLHAGHYDAFLEAKTLADHVKQSASTGDWAAAASKFADYWSGDGSWAAMPEKKREAFTAALQPTIHEFDAMLEEPASAVLYATLPAKTLVMHAPEPRRPILEIVEILENVCPHWTFKQITEGGHMAPLTKPELVNPLILEFLSLE